MILQIISTTDHSFLGLEFQDSFPLMLPNGSEFVPERIVLLPSGEYRFITSNFIIEAKEV